jgi:hypothetical protein
MSNVKPIEKKLIKIKENDLVDLIDNIVTEAVAAKKKEWINEQASKTAKEATMLENRIVALEKLIAKK